MENMIKREELELDRRNLQGWRKQLIMTDNENTYQAIDERVNDFIKNNKDLTSEEIDKFRQFLGYCNTYYISK